MRRKYRSIPSLTTGQILAILFGCLAVLVIYWVVSQLGTTNVVFFVDAIVGITLFVTVAIIVIALKIARKKWQLVKALKIADIDQMSGIEFEQYIGKLLAGQGYKTTYTPVSNDYGVDIIAKKDDISYAVQVKRYKALVGVDAVNQAVAGKGFYKCNRAMVVTNSFFTNQAFAQARANYVKLINRSRLAEWIVEFQNSK